jgi:hypothetical protein
MRDEPASNRVLENVSNHVERRLFIPQRALLEALLSDRPTYDLLDGDCESLTRDLREAPKIRVLSRAGRERMHVIGHETVRNNVEATLVRSTQNFHHSHPRGILVKKDLAPPICAPRNEIALGPEVVEVIEASWAHGVRRARAVPLARTKVRAYVPGVRN